MGAGVALPGFLGSFLFMLRAVHLSVDRRRHREFRRPSAHPNAFQTLSSKKVHTYNQSTLLGKNRTNRLEYMAYCEADYCFNGSWEWFSLRRSSRLFHDVITLARFCPFGWFIASHLAKAAFSSKSARSIADVAEEICPQVAKPTRRQSSSRYNWDT